MLLGSAKFSAALLVVALCAGPVAAAPIPDSQAVAHIGQTVTVRGLVSNVHVSGKGTVFIDFGGPYPEQDFTAVIFASAASAFGDASRFDGKYLEVTGTVSMWKGKPEIVVQSPSQIRVGQ